MEHDIISMIISQSKAFFDVLDSSVTQKILHKAKTSGEYKTEQ